MTESNLNQLKDRKYEGISTISILKESVDVSLHKFALESLRPVASGLGILFIVLIAAQLLFVPGPAGTILSIMASLLALSFFGISRLLNRPQSVAQRWVYPLASGMLLLLLCYSLAYLALTQDPQLSTTIALILICSGFLLLDWRWMITVQLIVVIGWFAVQLALDPDLNWWAYRFGVLLSVIVAIAIHRGRVTSLRRLAVFSERDFAQREEIERRARQLEFSIEASHRFTSILDLDTLLLQIVELVRERFGLYFVGVFLLDEDEKYVVARAGSGSAGRQLTRDQFRLRVGGDGLVGWVAAAQKHVYIEDVKLDARYVERVEVPNTRSELVLPLRAHNNFIGVLDLQSDRRSAFREDDIPVMHLLADQVAIAIQNASTYQSERSRRRLAETIHNVGRILNSSLDYASTLNSILAYLYEVISCERASLLLRNGDYLNVVAALGFPENVGHDSFVIPIDASNPDGIFRRICDTMEPLALNEPAEDMDWQQIEGLPAARVWLGVPLIRNNEVIGTLSLTREQAVPYSDEEIALALSFADQSVVALTNAQLYEQIQTEVKKRTEDLQKAYDDLEKLDRSKSEFIEIASHELRTPLTLLRGYSQMLSMGDDYEPAQVRRLADGINSGAQRMQSIINSMLDVAKIDSRGLTLYPEPVSIPSVIALVINKLEKSARVRLLELRMDESLYDLPNVIADPEAMGKVFYHLVINAIKYTPDGGNISIMGRALAPGEMDFVDGGIEIRVVDSGIGIDPDVHELVFNKFYQTGELSLHSTGDTKFKGGGPGLGLAIAKGVVEAHQGRIWVTSEGYNEESLHGSVFYVVLPMRPEDAPIGDNRSLL